MAGVETGHISQFMSCLNCVTKSSRCFGQRAGLSLMVLRNQEMELRGHESGGWVSEGGAEIYHEPRVNTACCLGTVSHMQSR